MAAGGPREVADCGTGQAMRQLADPAAPLLHKYKLGGTARERNRRSNPGLQLQERKPQTSDWKHLWGVEEAAAGETPSLTGEVVGETHRGLECAQAHPLGNQHQRGPV